MPLAERRDNSLRRAGVIKKGDTLFLKKRISPLDPREKGRGVLPLDPASLAVCGSKSCTRCAIRCGVRGFATNPYYCYRSQPRLTIVRRASDDSTAADCVRTRHCCARRGQMKQMLQLVENCSTVNTGRCTNGRRLATSPRGGETMRITFHIRDFTVTIIVKSRNRHSAK